MQFTSSDKVQLRFYANSEHDSNGSSEFYSVLTRTLDNYAQKVKLFDSNPTFQLHDCLGGLTMVISVVLPEPQQDYQPPSNDELKTIIANVISDELGRFLDQNAEVAQAILSKLMKNAGDRDAADVQAMPQA